VTAANTRVGATIDRTTTHLEGWIVRLLAQGLLVQGLLAHRGTTPGHPAPRDRSPQADPGSPLRVITQRQWDAAASARSCWTAATAGFGWKFSSSKSAAPWLVNTPGTQENRSV
jgi:hypothetical protein